MHREDKRHEMIQVTQENRSGWTVVSVSGRADASAADDLETALCSAIEGNSKIAADFAGVTYISSAGLRSVVQAARAAQVHKAEFVVCAASPMVLKVFNMSGMQNIVRIEEQLPC